MAVVLSKLFFPSEDATSSLIATYGVFAVGFCMRPLGGLLFGYLGDRIGRRKVLLLSVLMMVTGVILIGILPTYQEWGIWASLCLVLIHMFQGLSGGGRSLRGGHIPGRSGAGVSHIVIQPMPPMEGARFFGEKIIHHYG